MNLKFISKGIPSDPQLTNEYYKNFNDFENDSSPERSALVTHKDKIFFSIYADNVSYLYVSEADSILKNEETPYALLASKANTPIRGLTTSERYLWGVGGSGSSYVFRMSYSDYIVTALDNNEFFSN